MSRTRAATHGPDESLRGKGWHDDSTPEAGFPARASSVQTVPARVLEPFPLGALVSLTRTVVPEGPIASRCASSGCARIWKGARCAPRQRLGRTSRQPRWDVDLRRPRSDDLFHASAFRVLHRVRLAPLARRPPPSARRPPPLSFWNSACSSSITAAGGDDDPPPEAGCPARGPPSMAWAGGAACELAPPSGAIDTVTFGHSHSYPFAHSGHDQFRLRLGAPRIDKRHNNPSIIVFAAPAPPC